MFAALLITEACSDGNLRKLRMSRAVMTALACEVQESDSIRVIDILETSVTIMNGCLTVILLLCSSHGAARLLLHTYRQHEAEECYTAGLWDPHCSSKSELHDPASLPSTAADEPNKPAAAARACAGFMQWMNRTGSRCSNIFGRQEP